MYQPLADIIRPKSLEEMVGQRHLLGENGLLRRMIERKGDLPNLIFYGPSGTGKTTLAHIAAQNTSRAFHRLNATTATLADIREVMSGVGTLMAPNGILLYLDEIQYFNKRQQQSLLELMENGKMTLIASTTENPYFYVYSAVLSRATVFEFKPLTPQEILPAIVRAFSHMEERLRTKIVREEGLDLFLAESCGGDVRKSVNAAEMLLLSACAGGEATYLTLEDAKQVGQKSAMRYDRDGDSHYDILSALQKSIRGSDPNAGLHYLARLLEAGDLISPCRRLLVTASEDIGLAYPQAVSIVKACVDAAHMLGLPEARIPLAQAVVLLATAPKSNSVICAIDEAISDVKEGKSGEVPAHLRDGQYEGASKLARGEGYLYPHEFPNHYAAQQYLPEPLKERIYYQFGENKAEAAAKKYWENVYENARQSQSHPARLF